MKVFVSLTSESGIIFCFSKKRVGRWETKLGWPHQCYLQRIQHAHAFTLCYIFLVIMISLIACFYLIWLHVILLILFFFCLKGKYAEALCDAKAGRQFNPTYLEAIERGKVKRNMQIAIEEFAFTAL